MGQGHGGVSFKAALFQSQTQGLLSIPRSFFQTSDTWPVQR
jgi:hypothetical protein